MARSSNEYVGPYRLTKLVMTGQTSQVWEVLHDAKQARFALKMLLNDYRRDKEHMNYLKHEFAVAHKLAHPRVIKVHEIGSHQSSPYLIMELFSYPNLKQYIVRGVERLAFFVPKIIEQAAEGLGYFNAQGWVHRDVKPDNFLLSFEGDVKLIDFALAEKKKTGLSRLFGGRSKIQGTKSYMSPEQIRGQALDHRADLYSFGCLVYELIYGKPPYTGINVNELLNKHLKAAPPRLETVNSNVTSEFSELLRRTMAKTPQQRPESLEEFLREFRKLRVFKQTPKIPQDDG